MAQTTQAPIDGGTLGTGPDTLAVTLAEDAYDGDAQASIAIDGQTLTARPIAVAALEGAGQSEVLVFKGSFGPGAHELSVSFVNDAYGGTPATDRNLFVFDAALNGVEADPAQADLYSAGTARFAFAPAPAAAGGIAAAPDPSGAYLPIPPSGR